jgi:hypothetical protein
MHVMVVNEGGHRARGHAIPLRYADGRVTEQLKAIAAGGELVTPAVLQGSLSLEVTRTH